MILNLLCILAITLNIGMALWAKMTYDKRMRGMAGFRQNGRLHRRSEKCHRRQCQDKR